MIDCPDCRVELKVSAKSCPCGWKKTAQTIFTCESCRALADVESGGKHWCLRHFFDFKERSGQQAWQETERQKHTKPS